METEVRSKIMIAQGSIEEAEHALEAALAGIQAAPRAQKVAVSQAVEEAFARLRSAQALLASLDNLVDPDETGGR